MTSLDAARATAHELGRHHRTAGLRVSLRDAVGCVLAEDVVARAAVPGADTSAMDGWVVRGPGPWRVEGTVRMGRAPGSPLAPGTARAVTTGAALPAGASGVLRSEHARRLGDTLLCTGEHAPAPFADIRRAGEEMQPGEVLAVAGERVTPALAAAAAVAGLDELRVRRPPRVALVVLGDELVSSGVPAPGQTRDALGVALPAALAQRRAEVVEVVHAVDQLDAVCAALERGGVELLVTTGGTGHGRGDLLVPALERAGGRLVLRGIDMRPGHPTVLAHLGATPLLGLPGNPFAAIAALLAVGFPLLAGMLGEACPAPVPQPLAQSIAGAAAGTRVVAARHSSEGLVPVQRQSAAMVRGLVHADALALVGCGGAVAGDLVDTLPLGW